MSDPNVAVKATAAATYGGAGSAVVFGVTANELAAYVGAAVAVLAWLSNLAVTIYFKHRHLRITEAVAKAQPECATCPEREG
jgi:hypothetical protein